MPIRAARELLLRRRVRRSWDSGWSEPEFRGRRLAASAPQYLFGFERGWLSRGQRVLEIGCGLGQTAAELASRGLEVVAIDVSREAIRRARDAYGPLAGLTFETVDVCSRTDLGAPFDVILDTGCLHVLPEELHGSYARSIRRWSLAESRLVVRMYVGTHDRAARRRQLQSLLAPPFEIVEEGEVPPINPDHREGPTPVFHLVRRA